MTIKKIICPYCGKEFSGWTIITAEYIEEFKYFCNFCGTRLTKAESKAQKKNALLEKAKTQEKNAGSI